MIDRRDFPAVNDAGELATWPKWLQLVANFAYPPVNFDRLSRLHSAGMVLAINKKAD